ncbi:MAG: cytochrome P450 [Prochloraceae cyanobacterium]
MSTQYSKQSEIKTCPHLGETYQPLSNSHIKDPFPFYQRARSEEPLFYSPELDAYVLTRYDEIVNILKDPARFSSADTLEPVTKFTPEVFEVLSQGYRWVPQTSYSEGENHKRFRVPFNKAFSSERILPLENSIRTIANRLVDNFINNGEAEIISQFAYPLPVEVILTMYGVPLERIADVKRWCDDINYLITGQLTPKRQKECAVNFVAMQHFIASLIEERRKEPKNDFITDILSLELSMDELVMLLIGAIIAGHETTTNLIGNGLKKLLEKRQLWQALCDDSSLIPHAVEEVLRYESPIQSFSRTTTEEVSLLGVNLPKGTRVYFMFGSANRDESKYTNGEEFDIKRYQKDSTKHLAFGHGVHSCVGATLARLEARIALEILSQRLPSLRLKENQEFTYVCSLTHRGLKSLELEWDIS